MGGAGARIGCRAALVPTNFLRGRCVYYVDAAEIVTCLPGDPIVLCTCGLDLGQVRTRLTISVDMREQARNGIIPIRPTVRLTCLPY